jgi:hypothetical protein
MSSLVMLIATLPFMHDAIEGTMKIHCICLLNKFTMTQLLVKNLVYFFANYWDGQWE